jgi:hypothetical protein
MKWNASEFDGVDSIRYIYTKSYHFIAYTKLIYVLGTVISSNSEVSSICPLHENICDKMYNKLIAKFYSS